MPESKRKEIDLTTPNGTAIAKMFGELTTLSYDDFQEEDTLFGTVHVLGVAHHVTLVRVKDEEGVLEATNDPYERLEDILAGATEGRPQTVELPGIEGAWVLGVFPHC